MPRMPYRWLPLLLRLRLVPAGFERKLEGHAIVLKDGGARSSAEIRQRGSAMVEFAVILPILLVLSLGVIDFGYLGWQKLRLDSAVNEAARMAVTPNSNGGTNGSAVDEYTELSQLVLDAAGGMMTSEEVHIHVNDDHNPGCAELDVGESLKITTEFMVQLLVPMPMPGFGSSDLITLTSEAVYRCEWTGR